MRGSGDYDRKKKDTVLCLAGCAVVLFFVVAGNFDYNRKKIDTRLRPEKKICLAKKKIQLSVKKKVPAVQFVLVQLELKLIQIR